MSERRVAMRKVAKRSRSRTASKANKKDAIIKMAAKVFLAEGYASLGLRRIAKETKLSLGAIQHYFKTKEELFEQTFLDLEALYTTRAVVAQFESTQIPPDAALLIVMNRLFEDVVIPEKTRWIFEVWALSQRDPRLAERLNLAYREWTGLISRLLQKMHPEWKNAECETRAALAMALLDGVTVLTRPGGTGCPELSAVHAACMASWKALMV